MRPGRAPTLQLRAPASVSFGAEKGSLGQGSREGGRGAEPAQPFAGAAGGRGLAAGMEGATTACAAPRGGEVALRSTARHGSVARRGTAWHGTECSLGCPWCVGIKRESVHFHGSSGAGADPARLDAPSSGPTLRQRGTGLRNELTEQNQAA